MTFSEHVFQIFRAGRHTAMSGVTLNLSDSDLRATADTYNYASHRAPLVLGHPQNDAPAYGRVVSMFVKGGKLFAHSLVGPGLVQAVREGRYRNVSAAFFGPSAPANPVPGIWSLKHVGFLGAVGPAVPDMERLDFAAGDGCVCFASDCDIGACAHHEDVFQFAAPPGYRADPAAMSLYRLACEYRRACPELSIIEASILAAPFVTR